MRINQLLGAAVAAVSLFLSTGVASAAPAVPSTTCPRGKAVIVAPWSALQDFYRPGSTAEAKGTVVNCTRVWQSVGLTAHVKAPCGTGVSNTLPVKLKPQGTYAMLWKDSGLPAAIRGRSCAGKWTVIQYVTRDGKLISAASTTFTET